MCVVQVCVSEFGVSPATWLPVTALYAQRHPMAPFLTACITLFTHMCLSRNYVVIHEVEAMLPRDAVFRVVRNKRLDPTVRAAFTDLLVAVHIDREPHATIPVRPTLSTPCKLTHTHAYTNNLALLPSIRWLRLENVRVCGVP